MSEEITPEKIAKDSLERYSGSDLDDFGELLLITNFPRYVEYFSKTRNVPIIEGGVFKVAHCKKENISIIDFKIGSPAAALVVDCVAYLPFIACLHLGMCGGLRRAYKVGDYFVPVAGIRGEGTSDHYFPKEVPAMANFLVQKAVTNVLDEQNVDYHIGICHTTNKRFWEFDAEFVERLKRTRAQAIDMESATLYCAGYSYKLPLGSLHIISDLPLNKDGIKTKESSRHVLQSFTADHVEKGIQILHTFHTMAQAHKKGARRVLPPPSVSP